MTSYELTDTERSALALALKGHSLDTLSQDSGNHCKCGSDSRFEQSNGDHPWRSIDEHRADIAASVVGRIVEARLEHCCPVETNLLDDQRLEGEAFCADCPDHEACWTGWPCWKVRQVELQYQTRKQAEDDARTDDPGSVE